MLNTSCSILFQLIKANENKGSITVKALIVVMLNYCRSNLNSNVTSKSASRNNNFLLVTPVLTPSGNMMYLEDIPLFACYVIKYKKNTYPYLAMFVQSFVTLSIYLNSFDFLSTSLENIFNGNM